MGMRLRRRSCEPGGNIKEGQQLIMAQSVRVAVIPEAAQVAPGGQLSVSLTVQNAGGRPTWYRLAVDGIPPDWYSLNRPRISLRPAASTQVLLTVHPPAGTVATDGRYAISVQ